jgi:hypothetical protein
MTREMGVGWSRGRRANALTLRLSIFSDRMVSAVTSRLRPVAALGGTLLTILYLLAEDVSPCGRRVPGTRAPRTGDEHAGPTR